MIAQFARAGADFEHLPGWTQLVRQSADKPPVVAQQAIGQSQVAPIVECIRMLRCQRIKKLGFKLALHTGEEDCSGRKSCPVIAGNCMNPTPSPIDLITQATEAFPHRPSWDEYFMATAKLIASRSNCERLNVGCVIVTGGERNNRLVAAGYNGFLPGTPHVSRVRDNHEQATVHAEQNAIADAARRGSSVDGCTAYVTHYPCINCAKILAASGIAEIKYHEDYLDDPLVRSILEEAGVKIAKL